MQIKFNVTGNERKKLATAVSEGVNAQLNYLGAPTFSYEIGEYSIDRNGTLEGPDNRELLDMLEEYGFISESAKIADNLTVEMPRTIFTDESIENLEKMISSKAGLIKKALGISDLSIELTDTKVRFPWFRAGLEHEYSVAYSRFIGALCTAARDQKRVTATEHPVDNEKYAFRCFLLRLGFIGDEYKTVRKILLQNLSGNSAFKSISIGGGINE